MEEKNFNEVVTESNEFYDQLRYCFTINSFLSFVGHISNIFNSFFSLRLPTGMLSKLYNLVLIIAKQ